MDLIINDIKFDKKANMNTICVVGDGGCGKSALTTQFIHFHYVEEYNPTIEESYRRQILVDDETTILEVLDTAGQEEYSALCDQWYRTSEAFIIVFDITNRSTFEAIMKFRDKIFMVKEGEKTPIIIAGNKCDLESEREVLAKEVYEIIGTFGENCKYFETSAKERINVDEIFIEGIRQIRKLNKIDQKPKKKKIMKKCNIL